MKVAILYSGGKDSTYAIHHAQQQGWEISYLLSVKPNRKDCFLFHYATVEHTPILAKELDIKHIIIPCTVADPTQEAALVKEEILKQEKVDAVILGGTGLQETQLRSVKEALQEHGIDVFAAHQGKDHEELVHEMLDNGFTFMITQVASDGMMRWLGKKIDKHAYKQVCKDAKKYGFHAGFEGGYADTLVLSCPLFKNEFALEDVKKVIDDEYCGHIEAKTLSLLKTI
jgi:diphthine-ammonia ligase